MQVAVTASVLLMGCSTVERPSGKSGTLQIAVATDLALPKDIDTLRVRVQQEGGPNRLWEEKLGATARRLPTTLTVEGIVAGSASVHVVALGLRGDTPRVLSDRWVKFQGPETRVTSLTLSYLCLDHRSVLGSAESPTSACRQDGTTCLGGTCQSAIEEGGDATSELVDGLEPTSRSGSCLDLSSCFAREEAVQAKRVGDRCLIPGKAGGAEAVAVALVPSSEGGLCRDGGPCLVALDEGSRPDQVRVNGSDIEVPLGVCSDTVREVRVSRHCGKKTSGLPICAPWSSGGSTPIGPRGEGASSAPLPATSVGGPEPTTDGTSPPLDPASGGGYGTARVPGGTVSGLTKDGLVLVLDRRFSLAVPQGATTFVFPQERAVGDRYFLEIDTQPEGLYCSVHRATGRVGEGAEAPSVSCAPQGRVKQLAGGDYHTCGLLSDGSVRCWGDDSYGAVSQGSTVTSVPSVSNVLAMAGGARASCALLENHRVRCWGTFFLGGRTVRAGGPSHDVAGLPNAVQVSLGSTEACALLENTQVQCWTYDEEGVPQLSPPIPGLSGVRQISRGDQLYCVLMEDTTVRCWGNFAMDDAEESSPTRSIEGLSGVVRVSTGYQHACALLVDGTVRCWGLGYQGETGQSRPTLSIAGLRDVVQVVAGNAITCAVLKTGDARCWGMDTNPILLAGSSYQTNMPGLDEVVDVALGAAHACALRKDGSVRCWGDRENSSGLGTSPQRPIAGLTGTVALATAPDHTCALQEGGTVWCWGSNRVGQSGGSDGIGAIAGLTGVQALGAGDASTCARTAQDEVMCWGRWANNASLRGLDRLEGLSGVTSFALGSPDSCLRMNDGTVRCWRTVAVSNPPFEDYALPVSEVTQVSVSRSAKSIIVESGIDDTVTCMVLADSTVRCMGDERYGATGGSSLLEGVAGLSGAVQVSVGNNAVCAVLRDGTVRCWGTNDFGQTAGSSPTKSIEGLSGVVEVAVGLAHACARLKDGSVHCWGRNLEGQTAGSRPTTAVPFIRRATGIGARWNHTCAIDEGGEVLCWGDNTFGQSSPILPPKVVAVPIAPP